MLKKYFAIPFKIARKIIEFIIRVLEYLEFLVMSPLEYFEQNQCQRFSDCVLHSKIMAKMPAGADRSIEYPWVLDNVSIKSGRLLDIGSTAYLMFFELLPKDLEINAIDYNDQPIVGTNVKFVKGDIRKTDYQDEYFDCITCVSTLEHIGVAGRYNCDKDEYGDKKAMIEMIRILKPNGQLLITFPYGNHDVLPINRLYNKARVDDLFTGLKIKQIMYIKYNKKFNLWLPVDEAEASKTDMVNDGWYAICLINATK